MFNFRYDTDGWYYTWICLNLRCWTWFRESLQKIEFVCLLFFFLFSYPRGYFLAALSVKHLNMNLSRKLPITATFFSIFSNSLWSCRSVWHQDRGGCINSFYSLCETLGHISSNTDRTWIRVFLLLEKFKVTHIMSGWISGGNYGRQSCYFCHFSYCKNW